MNGCSGSSGYVAVVAGSESGRRMAQKMENDASSTSAGLYHFRPEHYLAALWSRGGKTVQNSEKQRKAGTAICRIGKLRMSHKQN